MSDLEKKQELHQLAAKGEALTPEGSLLNDAPSIQSSEDLRENLAKATKQAAYISREIETLILQNDILRKENHALRNAIEARLLEKVA